MPDDNTNPTNNLDDGANVNITIDQTQTPAQETVKTFDDVKPVSPQNDSIPSSENSDNDATKAKLDDLQHKYLRLYADFENYKREQQNVVQQETRRAKKSFLLATLVPLLDNLKLVVDFAPVSDDESVQKYLQTIQNILQKTIQDLDKVGAQIINPNIGDSFNEAEMEVIQVQDGLEMDTHCVFKVVSFGLKIEGLVVQPARVVISA